MNEYNHGRAPTYVTKNDTTIYEGATGNKILPAGSFVRPIEWCWVPKHILDDSRFKYGNIDLEVMCYTRYGFVKIRRDNIITI